MALLLYIGGSMLIGVFRKDEESKVNLSDLKHLLLAAVATSIDAAAVGVSLAMAELSGGKIAISSVAVLVVTMLAAILGISIHTVKAHKQKAMDNLRQSTDSDLLTFLILYLTSL